MDLIATHRTGRRTYSVFFEPGCLSSLPWGNEQFDVIILDCLDETDANLVDQICGDVVCANTDWVKTTGARAQAWHDALDEMSVRVGRQIRVGDGLPMTSWHDDVRSVSEMADLVVHSALGGCDHLVVVVLANYSQYAMVRAAIKAETAHKSDSDQAQ